MKTNLIDKDLWQFSHYVKPIDLSFHQYLLLAADPLLIHTGNMDQAKVLLPELEKLLEGRPLAHIFISHFEADECGGLPWILQAYPEAEVITSEVTIRQLQGFGIPARTLAGKPGESLEKEGWELEFVSYPSEMHLWEGILALEKKRGIFFSADLMMSFGESAGLLVPRVWQEEIEGIRHDQVPDPDKRLLLMENLGKLEPRLVVPGHGPCLQLA